MNNLLKNKINNIARKFEIDSAVIFSITTKLWGILAGMITLTLILLFFTKSMQGYYYTFSSILALNIFIEMGLGSVVQQFTSHEWSNLFINKNGEIEGNHESKSKLRSIIIIAIKWFTYGSIASIIFITIGGYFFLSNVKQLEINWIAPWISLCILSCINFLFTPIWAVLEGCNQVKNLYRFRLIQSIIINITVWVSLIIHLNLWVASAATLVSIVSSIVFLKKRYFIFFESIIKFKTNGPVINWASDMISMQWRVAISWVSGYFSVYFFTPVIFKFYGPEIAGRFGMTLSIINLIGSIGISWLTPRVPTFSILIAQNDYKELHRRFFNLIRIMFFIIFSLNLFFLLFIFLINFSQTEFTQKLSSRLLPPLPVFYLVVAQFFQVISNPFSSYMRSHKKEPVMGISLVQGILIVISTFFFGKFYTLNFIAFSYMIISIFGFLIVLNIWINFKRNLNIIYA